MWRQGVNMTKGGLRAADAFEDQRDAALLKKLEDWKERIEVTNADKWKKLLQDAPLAEQAANDLKAKPQGLEWEKTGALYADYSEWTEEVHTQFRYAPESVYKMYNYAKSASWSSLIDSFFDTYNFGAFHIAGDDVDRAKSSPGIAPEQLAPLENTIKTIRTVTKAYDAVVSYYWIGNAIKTLEDSAVRFKAKKSGEAFLDLVTSGRDGPPQLMNADL